MSSLPPSTSPAVSPPSALPRLPTPGEAGISPAATMSAAGTRLDNPRSVPDRSDAATAANPVSGPGPQGCTSGPEGTGAADRSGRDRPVRSWPLVLLAAPAVVEVWSGWVGIGQMTGFGQVRPLPGIWDSLHLNSAITLPVGVEAYAAYALRAWLSPSPGVSTRARRFAKWSAIGSLMLGMAGQAGYHLLTQAGATRAPWAVTTVVSCLPVLVLGMGAALAHLLHVRASEDRGDIRSDADGRLSRCAATGSPHTIPGDPDVPSAYERADARLGGRSEPAVLRTSEPDLSGTGTGEPADDDGPGRTGPPDRGCLTGSPDRHARLAKARAAAARITATGAQVSRRTLRAAGVRGSNADLGELSRMLATELACGSGGRFGESTTTIGRRLPSWTP